MCLWLLRPPVDTRYRLTFFVQPARGVSLIGARFWIRDFSLPLNLPRRLGRLLVPCPSMLLLGLGLGLGQSPGSTAVLFVVWQLLEAQKEPVRNQLVRILPFACILWVLLSCAGAVAEQVLLISACFQLLLIYRRME